MLLETVVYLFLGGLQAINEPQVEPQVHEHWSFRQLHRPQLPPLVHRTWPRNGIDHFIRAGMERAGVTPLPEANRSTLIRRLSFDLTGLPPTAAEVRSFIDDESPVAYERVVNRLLDSPAYGERWAQHWLDLARYADTDGFEHDHVRAMAFRYRDWVIEALNRDMPYDEFIRLQLAGDELRPGDDWSAAATGFVLCGPDMPDINLQEERRHMVLNELTGTVGSVLMGLQFGCAQCHDHKYDPITQADFYRLRGFFESARLFQKSPAIRALKQLDEVKRTTRVMNRGDFRRPGDEIEITVPGWLNRGGRRVEVSRSGLADWLTAADHPLTARVMVNRLWQHHFGRGLVATPSDVGLKGQNPSHPMLLDWLAVEFIQSGWSMKSLHRQIVESSTYREASYVEREHESEETDAVWIRGMMVDPGNQWYWRRDRRRLDGEVIRDSMLMIAGELNRQSGGRGVMVPLPQEIRETIRKDHWKVTKDEREHARRSVFMFVRRNLRYPMFEVFDRPDGHASCPTRSTSTIAPQALYMLNSRETLRVAQRLAATCLDHCGDNSLAQIEWLYVRLFSREPTNGEKTLAKRVISQSVIDVSQLSGASTQQEFQSRDVQARETDRLEILTLYCLSLLNVNEFVYVD